MILEHIESLIGNPQEYGGTVASWDHFNSQGLQETDRLNGQLDSYESVLDFYGTNAPEQTFSDVVRGIIVKPHIDLQRLSTIMSSSQKNDEISEELAEICGFENMELVVKILSNRPTVAKEMEQYLLAVQPDHPLFSEESAQQRLAQTFRENATRPLFSRDAETPAEILPHVYATSTFQGNILSAMGTKYTLPMGTERQRDDDYEEVIIPPAKPVPPRTSERRIPVSELDPLARGSFRGYTSLNRVQSIVYPTAYLSNENILICAPTGAGKTDVAMLTILRVLSQHRSNTNDNTAIGSTLNKDSFKIIYVQVAPMKALASEIVRKFGKRLEWLSIRVRELTGDMQMTKAEIAETQIIVTTPEKWDVVTRKPTGEGELASTLKLLIIDEIHLLNEERGAVIETIIARTLRQVESSQSIIRIVGLSATLPNYVDVAEFLSVSKQKGLFYFDSSFRPVPLEQHFIGIRGKPGSTEAKMNLDRVTFQKVSDLVARGHQVMVFVHARRETVKTALGLREMAVAEGSSDNFTCEEHPQWNLFRRQVGESRNKEMKQLYDNGFGIHHAGMLRSDRNIMERLFEARAIKVLCCTATLAWGVNLPAHAVVIKGTQVYDSTKGKFVDLSVLDVLQIFGRAGRPGMEDSGEGYICTTADKLSHYLDAVISQHPIESQFKAGLVDALNAEISLGTVANVTDAMRWMSYTYLFVRMKKNPTFYGISRDELMDDPQLGQRRQALVMSAAQKLAELGMILFEPTKGTFIISDLGRIAAKYYVRHESMEIFNEKFRPKMSEADVLMMLSMSTEFDQIQIRESEAKELEQIMQTVPCEVEEIKIYSTAKDVTDSSRGKVDINSTPKDVTDSSRGKVNILLQGFISRYQVDDFALVSDTMYVAQNGGRIARALLEIAISKKWAGVTTVIMNISKAIEKRLWSFDHPLKQFDLKYDIYYGLTTWADEWHPSDLATLDAEELGKLVHLNGRQGQALLNAAKQFPALKIDFVLRPLGSDVLKIAISLKPVFTWTTKVHGSSEPFWLWVEDQDGLEIIQMTHLMFRHDTSCLATDFIISIPHGIPPAAVTVRYVSDRWIGAEDEVTIPLDSLLMPKPPQSQSSLLDVPLLSPSVLRSSLVESVFAGNLINFNPIQSQVIWSVVHTKANLLLCAPTGSGSTLLAEALICTTAHRLVDTYILVVVPHKALATSIMCDLRPKSQVLGMDLDYSTDFKFPDQKRGRIVRFIDSSNLHAALSQRDDPRLPTQTVDLVILDHLEQLDPMYELAVSILLHTTQAASTRFVGFSHSLSNPADLAAWLHVEPSSLFSLHPSNRSQALTMSVQTFNIPHSASLFKVMAKPTHAAVQAGQDHAIVFVPSRSHCRSVAFDLLTHRALENENDRGYLPGTIDGEQLRTYLDKMQEKSLVDLITRGIGLFHGGLQKTDRNVILELYAEGIIRVLLVPHDSCWSLPIRAPTVVVMGTQYMAEAGQLRDYDLVELVQMQSHAVRHVGAGHLHLFCQAESKDALLHFLNDGLPLESKLLETTHLASWYRDHQKRGHFLNKQDLADVLSFTYLSRRIVSNPAYYDCSERSRDGNLSRIIDGLHNKYSSI